MTGNGPIVANGVLYAIEEKPLLSTTPKAYIQTYSIANKAWGSNITVPLQNDEEIENISSDSANNLYVEYKRHFSSCDRDGIEVYDSVRGTWNIDILSANALFAGDHPYLDCPTYFVGQQDAFYSLLADRITNALSIYQNLSGVWEKNNPIALSDHANPYAMYVDSSTGNLYVLMQDYDINIKGWRYHIERYANTASGVWSNLGSGNATAALSEGGSINNASMLVNNSYLYAQGTEASNGALTLLRTLA